MLKIVNFIRKPQYLIAALCILGAISLFISFIDISLASLRYGTAMDTYPTNGTFQLYNPLMRLAQGQIPGHDFPFFHGVGVPLLHFPTFMLLGHNVFAAETSKFFVTFLLFMVGSWAFFYAFFRDHKKAIIATAVICAIGPYVAVDTYYPGNAVLGVRTAFPLLVAAAVVWETSRTLRITKRLSLAYNDIAALILLALAFQFGTEQGLAAMAAFFLLKLVPIFKAKQKKPALVHFGALLLLGTATTIGLLAVSTRGHIFEALSYALVSIPNDQGWYFGVPPNYFISWEAIQAITFASEAIVLYVAIIAGLALSFIAKKSNLLTPLQQRAVLFLIAYGVIVFIVSATGYYAPATHLIPLQRGMLLVSIAAIVLFAFHFIQQKRMWFYVGLVLLAGLGSIITLDIRDRSVAVSKNDVKALLHTAKQARQKDDYFVLSQRWLDATNSFMPLIPKDATLWSTYTSVYDSLHGTLNPSKGGEDYIIHALGDERRNAYNQQFIHDRPDYVITMRPSFFSYEEWLWSGHWAFYKQLFTNYELIAHNRSHVLWKLKTDASAVPDSAPQSASKTANNSFTLPGNPTDRPIVYEVSVNYTASSNLGLSRLDKLGRYFIDIKNTDIMHCPVSLPSDKTNWTFPVAVAPYQQNVSLTASTPGPLITSSLAIHDITYKRIPVDQTNDFVFIDNRVANPPNPPKRFNCTN